MVNLARRGRSRAARSPRTEAPGTPRPRVRPGRGGKALAACALALLVVSAASGCDGFGKKSSGKGRPGADASGPGASGGGGTGAGASGGGGAARPQGPADRPAEAVTAALVRLDACALLDKAAGTRTGMGDRRWELPDGPHGCTVTNDPIAGDEVSLTLGSEFGHTLRHGAKPIDIDGVKAYVDYQMSSDVKRCAVQIPVSFTRSIEITSDMASAKTDESCKRAQEFAKSAIGMLRSDKAPVADPAKRPLADWDACGILGATLGEAAKQLTYGNDNLGLDGCETRPAEPGADGGRRQTPKLRISYDSDPLVGKGIDARPVRDRKAAVSERSSSCVVEWGHGPSGIGGTLNGTVELSLTSDTCANALDLAGRIMDALRGKPQAGAAPQNPLTIATDQPDDAAAGACVDFPPGDAATSCVPYTPVQAPGNAAEILKRGDAATACAITVDEVKRILGPEMQPIVYGDFCMYVEPSHERTVSVSIPTSNAAGEYGGKPDLYQNRRETQVGGVPAVTFNHSVRDGAPTAYSIYLAAAGDLNAPGAVGLEIEVASPRGAAESVAPDRTQFAKLDELAAALAPRFRR